jgi:hypothetical protein
VDKDHEDVNNIEKLLFEWQVKGKEENEWGVIWRAPQEEDKIHKKTKKKPN